MSAEHFDRIAKAWLDDGPDELSVRVLDAVVDEIHLTRQRRANRMPWRLPTMTSPARVAAAALVGVLAIGGAIFILRPVTSSVVGPPPSPSPWASVGVTARPSQVSIPALTQTFTSTRHGYAVSYPSGWTSTAATAAWSAGTAANWGSPALDAIRSDSARFVGTSQRVGAGKSVDAYLTEICLLGNGTASECSVATSTWPQIQIGGHVGYLGRDGVNALGGTVAPVGISKLYDAIAVVGGRGYDFTLDGLVDRAVFQAFLDTVVFTPSSATDLPALPKSYASPWYGYSISTANSWTTTAATTHFVGTDNSGPAIDTVAIAGTDSRIGIASQRLAKGQTFDQWLTTYHASVTAAVPTGCDGGAPGGWPTTRIGPDTGRYYQLCNAAEAIIEKGGRVYLFTLANVSFDNTQHLSVGDFLKLLTTVALDPAGAKD